ncbi:hypothetical protein HN51_034995 [Arachis hypogaea]|uniref:TMEM205-like domain-containing protein n=1 Tax=Arachis hypogaea TaxID=3818 RepID=A0A445A6I4_ARAHY|nr:uncharacterized protein LOC107629765 isoform X1 [Arachis ipaensis]XP_025643121.1 uncharacterized protein LOC112737429 [Arachis hypogaea]QHN99921.1 Transmembrane protein [Arachis hypogaea]RYR22018.1 hypothetical protein Ahy_B03g067301 [Arachis hypogaea]
MMNVLALSLFLTSLAGAGLFSPTPSADQKQAESTIVKEGHRVVVVEFDGDGHQNTKISISPEQHAESDPGGVLLNTAKEKMKEAASVLPNVGQGLSSQAHDAAFLHASKDLICDAYGKCKHKIASAVDKAKDKAHDVIDLERESLARKKEAARGVVEKAKETVYDKAHDAKEYTKEAVEKAKEQGQTLRNDVVMNVTEGNDMLLGVRVAMRRVAAEYLGSMDYLDSLMGVANLMGFATAYGLCVWVTFFSSYVLSRVMPRQQFAVVQSKIYPVYFKAMAYSTGMALVGHVFGHRTKALSRKAEIFQAYNLIAALFTVFANSVYLEPRATKLMFERMKLEKEEGRGREDMTGEHSRTEEHQHQHSTADPNETGTNSATTPASASGAATPTRGAEQDAFRSKIFKLNEKLKKLNSYSSILNILTLMFLTWHLIYLGQRVHHGPC